MRPFARLRTRSTTALLVALLALAPSARAAEEPPLPDSRLGHRTAPLLLLSRPDVRADLGLTAEQAESAAGAIRSFYVQAAALRGKPTNAETVRARRAVDDEAYHWIDARLSPEQKARLAEIDLQWEGPSALVTRPAVVRTLHLSKEQIAGLNDAIRRRDAARAQGQPNADHSLAETALQSLDGGQRETWKGLLGKPMTFHLPR